MTTPTCGPPSCGLFFLCGHDPTEGTCDVYTYNSRNRRWSVATTTNSPGEYQYGLYEWGMAYMDGTIFCVLFNLQLGMLNLSMPHKDWTIMGIPFS